jgi:hypothetical protein
LLKICFHPTMSDRKLNNWNIFLSCWKHCCFKKA